MLLNIIEIYLRGEQPNKRIYRDRKPAILSCAQDPFGLSGPGVWAEEGAWDQPFQLVSPNYPKIKVIEPTNAGQNKRVLLCRCVSLGYSLTNHLSLISWAYEKQVLHCKGGGGTYPTNWFLLNGRVLRRVYAIDSILQIGVTSCAASMGSQQGKVRACTYKALVDISILTRLMSWMNDCSAKQGWNSLF